MKTFKKNFRSMALLASAPLLAFGIVACGNEDGSTSQSQQTSAVTVTETAPAQSTQESDAAGQSAKPSADEQGDQAPKITLSGKEVKDPALGDGRCSRGEDDGREQIQFESGINDSADELDIDIDRAGLRLDSLELELFDVEWEVKDEDKAGASVEEHDGNYTVTARVTKDDTDEKQDIEVSFRCAV